MVLVPSSVMSVVGEEVEVESNINYRTQQAGK